LGECAMEAGEFKCTFIELIVRDSIRTARIPVDRGRTEGMPLPANKVFNLSEKLCQISIRIIFAVYRCDS
jgi:hypothetical protein